jgi:flagellar biosynthesis chaperone FliJ
MMNETIQSCFMAAFLFLSMQSLADVAREEAERRRLLDQQGVEAKSVDSYSEEQATVPSEVETSKNNGQGKDAARNYRNILQKLDKAILQEERRLEAKRERLQSTRRAPPKFSSRSAGNQSANSISRLQREIEDMEERLKQLRQERSEKYEEGLKAGFLPGELDGKGLLP